MSWTTKQRPRQEVGTPPADRAAGRYWVRATLGLLLLAALAFPFLALLVAVERRSPSVQRLDTAAADRLNALANENSLLLDASLALTHLGDSKTAWAVFIVAAVVLWGAGSRRLAAYVSATGLGLGVLIPASKVLVGRERPTVDLPVAELPGSASFPSGHAMTALVLTGCLVVVALWRNDWPRWARASLVALAVVLTVGVGLTRLMLGVHYVTDVVAGWSMGAAWLAITIWALRRRDAERPRTTAPTSRVGPGEPLLPRPPLPFALALGAAWAAAVIIVLAAGLIITGPFAAPTVGRVDAAIVEAVVNARSTALTELARAGSAPSDTAVVIVVTAAAALVLAQATRRWRPSLFLVVCVAGESLAYFVVSRTVDRMRPDVPDLTQGLPTAASWPSGHVSAAVALYGAIAVLLVRTRLQATVAVTGVALLALLVVGTSRVYLAAHYPSDVVAGAVLGAAWLLLCWRILRPAPVSPDPPAATRRTRVVPHPAERNHR